MSTHNTPHRSIFSQLSHGTRQNSVMNDMLTTEGKRIVAAKIASSSGSGGAPIRVINAFIQVKDYAGLDRYLGKHQIPLDILTSALQTACMSADSEAVEIFSKHGANVNHVDQFGTTLLHFAMRGGGDQHVVKALVAHGLDYMSWRSEGLPLLHWACTLGYIDLVEYMVEHRKASLQEPDDNGRLPIHVAAVSGQPDVLTYLINAVSQRLLLSNVPGRFRIILEDGSGDGMSDSDDERPGGDLSLGLQIRPPNAQKNHEKLRRRSVNAYRTEQLGTARTVAAANYLDIHHWTPLHHASCEEAINCYPECLKILLKNGADPMLPTLQGKTALDLAYAAGRSQVLVDVLPKRQLIALLMQIDDIVPLRVRTGQVPVIPQLHTKLLSAEKPDVAPPQLIVPQRSEREGSIPRTPSERARKGYSFIRRLADTMGDEEITSHHMWKAKGGKSESTNLMSIWRKILLNDNVELLETLRDSLVWRQNKPDSCAGDVDFHAVTNPTESTATTMTDFDSAQRLTSKQLAELFNDCYENGTGVFSHVQANYQNLIRARDFLTVLRAMTGLLTFNTLTTHAQYPTSTPSMDDVEILRPMHKSLLFLAILCGRFRVAEQLLRMRQFDMLPAAVLVLLILRRLRKEPSFPQQVLSELDRFTDRIESIAVDLLNLVSFKDNTPEKMICHDMLNVRLRTFGNLSLVDLFAIAKCNGLLGLPCTQFLLDERWYGVLTYVPNWVRWISRVFPLVGLLYVEIKDRQDRCNCCASTVSTSLIGRQMSVQDDNSLSSKQGACANKITKHAKWTDVGNSYSAAIKDKAHDDRPVKSVYAQSPEPVITIYQRITSQNEESSKSPRVHFLAGIYRSPSMKFCLHSLFHLLFLWCFSVVCFYHLHFDFSVAEIIALAYVAGYAIEEIRQILLEGLKDGWAEYLKDGWNWIDILAVSLTGVGFCVRMNAQKKTEDPLDESRDQILYAARNVYMLGLNLFYMRTLHITSISQVIGPRLKMMADMLRKDLLPMILVFVIFIFSFGVWFQGLIHPNDFYKSMAQMEIYTKERRHEGQKLPGSFKKMIKRAFYSIFEVSIVIDEQHCDDSKECGSERGMEIVLYFVLVVYTWIVNIILINLLIALFSNTVSRIDQKAAALWLAGRYKMVKEYSERTLLPPPLNILCVLLELLQFIVSQCKNCIRKRSNPKEEFSDTSAYGLTKDQSTYSSNDFRAHLRHTTWIRHALLNSNPDTTKQEVDAVLKFILLQSFALQNRRHILGTGLLGQGFISWPAGTQESETAQSQTSQELSQATTRINKRINVIEASLNIFLKKLSAVPHEAARISNPKRLPRPLKMPSTRMIRTPSNASTVSVHIPTSSEIFASLSKQSSFSSPRVSLTRGQKEASRPDGLPEHEKPKAKR
ncbi:hypothetical protein CRM22_000276 [Opisthorchis felineus]|uniref:Ion transport domain-containing protein n=1 Tax=Opisthorchis felineus TaxID=147828 RepID=A0A4S2MG73_OPIFE|nr:hypothetical protein CRM22_000276 [Opisthorchis felineus]